ENILVAAKPRMGVSWLTGCCARGRIMPNYRFSSLAVDGALVSSCVREAQSDDEAKEIAGELLTEDQSDAVEVWSVWRLVHRAVRDPSHSLPLIKADSKTRGFPSHHRRG